MKLKTVTFLAAAVLGLLLYPMTSPAQSQRGAQKKSAETTAAADGRVKGECWCGQNLGKGRGGPAWSGGGRQGKGMGQRNRGAGWGGGMCGQGRGMQARWQHRQGAGGCAQAQ